MDELFARIFSIFSIEYMFTVIMASYLTIKVVDFFNGSRIVPAWLKRTITFIVGIGAFFVFKTFTDVSVQCLIASFFAALFVYDSAIKFIIKKFKIDYRK